MCKVLDEVELKGISIGEKKVKLLDIKNVME